MQTFLTFLAPLLDHLLTLAGATLLGVGTWAGKLLADYLKLSADSRVRDYLNEIIANAVSWAEEEMHRRLAAAMPQTAPADGASVPAAAQPTASDWRWARGEAAAYIASRAPDALAHFEVTPQGLHQIVQTRMSGG